MNEKYPKVRLPKELYDEIKHHADRKGTSIGDTIQFAWNSLKGWKKAEMPNVSILKERMEKGYTEKVNEMKKQLEEQLSIRYEGKIKDLEDALRDAGIWNKELDEEKEQWKAKFENEKGISPMLKLRIDELENELKIFQSSDMDSLRKEIEIKQNIIISKDSEIERLNGIIEGNKAKIVNAEQLINENEDLKRELSELPQENDSLRQALRKQATENKLIKDTIKKGMENMLLMESALDIKLALKRFVDDVVRKIDYELEKQQVF